ncbi:putative peroxisomal acyl-coenzyme A oxidase 3 isoform X5 [Apostichopus japonicus]|uniref:Putative peroxisomal acyl-coenzyme A oxidase 3 isoform X5 n=1 Tax=Stichopus japonicus TaxID=307972 RepID=A0A2G8L7G5_STIJA|nr:putative peroxisomal acyl-coenzyme A oxidase 3 isoform X5 [Apostichopus japonicus]
MGIPMGLYIILNWKIGKKWKLKQTFASFNKVRIPKDNLLNRLGDVVDDGRYVSQFKSIGERLGATLSILSSGRIAIIDSSAVNLASAVSIAIRYSAVRRQFGPTKEGEIPVLEYQLQQWRLLPYVAGCYIYLNFARRVHYLYVEYLTAIITGSKTPGAKDDENQQLRGSHNVASRSAERPVVAMGTCGVSDIMNVNGITSSWRFWSAIANRFGVLRDDNDPNVSYEGDNNVILQQTSRHLPPLQARDVFQGMYSKVSEPYSSYTPRDVFPRLVTLLLQPGMYSKGCIPRLVNLLLTAGCIPRLVNPTPYSQGCIPRLVNPTPYSQGCIPRLVNPTPYSQGCIPRLVNPTPYSQGCIPRLVNPTPNSQGCIPRLVNPTPNSQGCIPRLVNPTPSARDVFQG